MRISVSVTDELLRQVDEAANKLNINRSAYIAISIQEKIKNDNIATNLPKITELMQQAMIRQAKNLDTSDIEKDLNKLGVGRDSDNQTKK